MNIFQGKRVVKIPSEFHRFVIGQKGSKKKDLESRTCTKIIVPPLAKKSNEIIIIGSRDKLDEAEEEIRSLVQRSSMMATEKIEIPKIYHQFIYGP